jgi:hypothetical protein
MRVRRSSGHGGYRAAHHDRLGLLPHAYLYGRLQPLALGPQELMTWTGSAIDPPAQKPYTLQTVVRDWFNSGVLEDAAGCCGVTFPTELAPDHDPRHITCVVGALHAAGIDESAVQFFTETHLLLTDFHSHGRIDIGYAAAPWVNMGRPQAVFLNGDPSAVPVFSLDRRLSGFRIIIMLRVLVNQLPRSPSPAAGGTNSSTRPDLTRPSEGKRETWRCFGGATLGCSP